MQQQPGPADRGQTLQDYALGISVFVLSVTAALTLFPSFAATYGGGPSEAVSAQGDRVARTIVQNNSVPGAATELDADSVGRLSGLDEPALRERFALPETTRLNVTVETLNGTTMVRNTTGAPLVAGLDYRSRDGGVQRARIVRLDDEGYTGCVPACRLVVRVW